MLMMEHLGFTASIQRAPKLQDNGCVHGLPSGSPVPIHAVDAFKHPLAHWITGAGSYVVPVRPNWGLWFDWTKNDHANTAILPSVKGMNPITGKKTEGYGLEQYKACCPIHKTEFKDGLFCEECDYRWPAQNYVAYPNVLWWDGFRTQDGKVRQFFFTEDMLRSIPELVMGETETVPAFGFCFYRPKTLRPSTLGILRSSSNTFAGKGFGGTTTSNVTNTLNSNFDSLIKNLSLGDKYSEPDPVEGCMEIKTSGQVHDHVFFHSDLGSLAKAYTSPTASFASAPEEKCRGINVSLDSIWDKVTCSSCNDVTPISDTMDWMVQERECMPAKKISKSVGVGAGAQINQGLSPDTLMLDDWNLEPSAVMRLYFVFEEEFKEISAKGMKDWSGHPEGFLNGLPVG